MDTRIELINRTANLRAGVEAAGIAVTREADIAASIAARFEVTP